MIDISEYYRWIVDQVNFYEYDVDCYQLLFQRLFEVEYKAVISRDINRVLDGKNKLYNIFLNNIRSVYEPPEVYFGDHDYCSVLEMLIALSIRISDDIMYCSDANEGISKWFWIMLENLEFDQMDDDNYDQFTVDNVLHTFIERLYDESGSPGNIFYTNIRGINMKDMEIWDQCNCYFDEFMEVLEC